jgi:hypothetical protein
MRKTSLKAAILWAALALAAALAVGCESATSSKPNVSGNDEDKKDDTQEQPEQVVTNDSSKGIMGIEAADRIFGTDGWSGDGGSVTIRKVKSFAEMEAWIKDSTVTQKAVTLNRAPGSGTLFAAGGLGLQFYAAKIDGKDVTKIAANAFSKDADGRTFSDTDIAAVRLPETIRDVAADAFSGSGLSVVIIPAAVLENESLADMISDLSDALKEENTAPAAPVTPGTGTEPEDPLTTWRVYKEIGSIEELAKIADPTDEDYPMDGYYKLTADLDFEGFEWVLPIGTNAAHFRGIFDGNGKTIKNFALPDDATLEFYGLFGRVTGAKISNLTIKLDNLFGELQLDTLSGAIRPYNYRYVGALAAYASYSVFTNIRITGESLLVNMKTNDVLYVGALAGTFDQESEIVGCSSNIAVRAWGEADDYTGAIYIGGLAGASSSGDIRDSYASGNVSVYRLDGGNKVSGTGSPVYIGGLAGTVRNISNSYATGDIETINGHINYVEAYIGGLAGTSAMVDDSYAEGDVTVTAGRIHAGGLVGDGSNIKRSHASGNVTFSRPVELTYIIANTYVGGLAGTAVSFTDSYATGKLTGVIDIVRFAMSSVGGLVGRYGGIGASIVSANSYAEGDIDITVTVSETGTSPPSLEVGGLIGNMLTASNVTGAGASIANCYASGAIKVNTATPNTEVGGLVGLIGNPNSVNISDSAAGCTVKNSQAKNPGITVISAGTVHVNRIIGFRGEDAVLSGNSANGIMKVKTGTDGDSLANVPQTGGTASNEKGEDVEL